MACLNEGYAQTLTGEDGFDYHETFTSAVPRPLPNQRYTLGGTLASPSNTRVGTISTAPFVLKGKGMTIFDLSVNTAGNGYAGTHAAIGGLHLRIEGKQDLTLIGTSSLTDAPYVHLSFVAGARLNVFIEGNIAGISHMTKNMTVTFKANPGTLTNFFNSFDPSPNSIDMKSGTLIQRGYVGAPGFMLKKRGTHGTIHTGVITTTDATNYINQVIVPVVYASLNAIGTDTINGSDFASANFLAYSSIYSTLGTNFSAGSATDSSGILPSIFLAPVNGATANRPGINFSQTPVNTFFI